VQQLPQRGGGLVQVIRAVAAEFGDELAECGLHHEHVSDLLVGDQLDELARRRLSGCEEDAASGPEGAVAAHAGEIG